MTLYNMYYIYLLYVLMAVSDIMKQIVDTKHICKEIKYFQKSVQFYAIIVYLVYIDYIDIL